MSSDYFEYGGVKYPLYPWQADAFQQWENNDCKGIVKGATGTGKTRVAHRVIASWLNKYPDAKITVIVPSIPLLGQWVDELKEIFVDIDIGLVGDGNTDSLEKGNNLNVVVMASAAKKLKNNDSMGENHLIIVDECHRLGARYTRMAMTCNHQATLGLSGTPKREDTGLKVVQELLGEVVVEYLYDKALADGVIPPFKVKAIQADLTEKEQKSYDVMQKRIVNLVKSLTSKYGNGGNLVVKCQTLLKQRVSDIEIGLFLKTIREQKDLINSAINRFVILDILIAKETMNGKKTMAFHESVEDIQVLAKKYAHMNALQYHYKVGNKKSKTAILDAFKAGDSNLLFSCRALTEGVNIPDAEVGIMVSGTRSARSRIQTVGRLLRGDEATIYFIYFPQTKDSRSLANFIKEGKVPKENVDYWRFDNQARNIVMLTGQAHETSQETLDVEINKIAHYDKKKSHGRLECKHCGRGNVKAKSKPFRTLNGLNYHMEQSCKDASKNIYRCIICRKAYAKEENRNNCVDSCCTNPPDIERMSFDDFMDGFKNKDKLHDGGV